MKPTHALAVLIVCFVGCGSAGTPEGRPVTGRASGSASARPVVYGAASTRAIGSAAPSASASAEATAPDPPRDAYLLTSCPKVMPYLPVHTENIYSGTIAGKKVVARFQCDSTPCKGYYFYQDAGEMIELLPDGKAGNVYVEATHKKPTGHLELSGPPTGADLTGKWMTTDKKRTEAIALTAIAHNGKPQVFKRVMSESGTDGKDCRENIESFEIAGLADAAIEQGINRMFDAETIGSLTDPRPAIPPDESICNMNNNSCKPGKNGHIIVCGPKGSMYQSNMTFTVKSIDEMALSIELAEAGDAGGIHGWYDFAGYTIDLGNGELAGMSEWFKPEAEKIDFSQYTPHDDDTPQGLPFSLRGPSDVFRPNVRWDFDALSRPNAETGQRCSISTSSLAYFTKDGVELIPDVGGADRAAGGIRAKVPWKDMAGLILPDSPIAHFAK